MKVHESSEIRNVALIGHGHAGKTSLACALFYSAGATERLMRPDEGNAITDFDEEEIYRKISISSSLAALTWQQNKVNLIDTPGYNIFLDDTRSTLVAADAALLVLDGVAGVEVSSEKVWGFAEKFEMPCAIFVNKMDRDRADFNRTVEIVHERFGRSAIPIQMPIGADKSFNGIIDLIRMEAYCYSAGGQKGKRTEIPTPYQEAATKAHEALVEMVAEGKDDLMEEFFATGTLPVEHIVSGLREEMRERRLFPILCGSAAQNIGGDLLLDFIGESLPSPLEGTKLPAMQGNETVKRGATPEGPVSLFVFKTLADPFAGRLSYFKVMSGSLVNDISLVNMRTNQSEKLAHISTPFGKQMTEIRELKAGDIGVVAKLKDTLTSDTLCEKSNCLVLKGLDRPEPSIAYAIAAKTRNDEDRLSAALHKILEEDLSLRFYRDPQTKEFLLAGNGQQHVEIVCSRLKRRYNVDVELHAPKIPYRETIRGTAQVQGRHKKQTGGHGQFGDCWIKIEPLPRGEQFQFVNSIFGGAIPKQFVPAVEKGIVEAAEQGFLAGYPVVDFRVTLYDGSYHDVDSSEMAFKLAGRKAFRAAMQQAKPVLLEPVMQVEVETPTDFAGDLMSDFNSRRGRIAGMDINGDRQVIRAQVPMSEMLSYQNDLISKTQGRASFHMEFDHYDMVPQPQAEKIIAAAKTHLGHGDEDEA
jgi:elongation factor G